MHSNEKEKDLNRLNKCMLPGEKTTRDTKPGCLWNGFDYNDQSTGGRF